MTNTGVAWFVIITQLVSAILLILILMYGYQIRKLTLKHFDKKHPFAWYQRQLRILEYCQTHAPELKLYEYSRSLVLVRQLLLLALGIDLAICVALMMPPPAVALMAYHFWIFAIFAVIALAFASVLLRLRYQKGLVDFIKNQSGEVIFPKAWHLDGVFDLAVHEQLYRYYKALLLVIGIFFAVDVLYVAVLI